MILPYSFLERIDLVLELKNNASKLLLAIMESRADSENAERILISMSPRQLIEVASNAYFQKINENENDNSTATTQLDYQLDEPIDTLNNNNLNNNSTANSDLSYKKISATEVGHNIYLLCHQLAQQNKGKIKTNCLFFFSEKLIEFLFIELATYLKLNNLNLLTQQQQQYGNNLNYFTNSIQPFKNYGFMTPGNLTPQIITTNFTNNNLCSPTNLQSTFAANNLPNYFSEDASQRIRESLTYYAKHTAQIEIVRSG